MKKIYIIIMLLFICSSFLEAGDVSRKGTTGADQLLIPVGARSIATSGAFMANVSGVEAIYYNPAGLSVAEKSEAMFSYMNYLADINLTYLAAGANLDEIGTFGISFKTLDFGDIPVTTNQDPDGASGDTYSPSYYTMGLSYSRVITDRVAAGFTVNLINETIQNTTASGIALDFGVQYSFGDYLNIGVVAKNIGSNMRYEGSDLQYKTVVPGSQPNSTLASYEVVTEEFQIPSYFEMSVAYTYAVDNQNNLALATTFRSNNSLEDYINFGMEYSFSKILFLRGGYNLMSEKQDNNVFGLTMGAGLSQELGNNLDISFDYAYRDVKDFPTSNHIVTVKLGFK